MWGRLSGVARVVGGAVGDVVEEALGGTTPLKQGGSTPPSLHSPPPLPSPAQLVPFSFGESETPMGHQEYTWQLHKDDGPTVPDGVPFPNNVGTPLREDRDQNHALQQRILELEIAMEGRARDYETRMRNLREEQAQGKAILHQYDEDMTRLRERQSEMEADARLREKEIVRLKAQLTGMHSEKVTEVTTHLEKQKVTLERKCAQLSDEIKGRTEQSERLARQIGEMSEAWEDEREQLEGQKDTMQQRIAFLEEKMTLLEDRRDLLAAEKQELMAQRDELQAKVEQEREAIAEDLKRMVLERETFVEERERERKEAEQWQERANRLSEQVDALRTSLREAEERRQQQDDSDEKTLEDARKRVQELERCVAEANGNLAETEEALAKEIRMKQQAIADNETTDRERDQAQRALVEIRKENEELVAQLHKADAGEVENQTRIESLTHQCEEFSRTVAQLTEERKLLEQRPSHVEVPQAEDHVYDLEEQKRIALEQANPQPRERVDELSSLVTQLETEKASLEEELHTCRRDTAAEKQRLLKEREDAQSELGCLKSRLGDVQQELDRTTSDSTHLRARIDALEDETKALRKDAHLLKEERTKREQQLEDQLRHAWNQLKEEQQGVEEATTETNALRARVAMLQEKLQAECTHAEDEHGQAMAEVSRLRNELDETTGILEQVQSELGRVRGQSEVLRSELVEAVAARDATMQKLDVLSKDRLSVEKEERKRKELEEQIAELLSQNEVLEDAVAKYAAENKRMKGEHTDLVALFVEKQLTPQKKANDPGVLVNSARLLFAQLGQTQSRLGDLEAECLSYRQKMHSTVLQDEEENTRLRNALTDRQAEWEMAVQQAEERIQEAQGARTRLEVEYALLQGKFSLVREQEQNWMQARSTLEEECKTAKERAEGLMGEVTQLRKVVDGIQQERCDRGKESEQLRTELASATQDVERLRTEVQHQSREILRLREEKEDTMQEVGRVEEKWAVDKARLAELEQDFSNLSNEMTRLRREQGDESSASQTQIARLQESLTKSEKELERLRFHLMEINESQTSTELERERLVLDLKDRLAGAESRGANVEKEANDNVQQLTSSLTKLQMEYKEKAFEAQQSAQALANLQAVIDQYQADNEMQLQSEIARANKKLQEAQDMAAQNTKAAEEAEARVRDLQAQFTATRTELTHREKQILHLSEQVALLHRNLEESMARFQNAADEENMVDRRVISQMIIRYFEKGSSREVLDLIARILQFSDEDKMKVGLVRKKSGWASLLPAIVRLGGTNDSHPTPALPDLSNPNHPGFLDMWTEFLLRESGQNGTTTAS